MSAPVVPFPLVDADRCVKCGLCLPHCPTYLQTRHEGDSPRGRIALLQGLATGVVPMTHALEAHMDGCLACRACEPVCPAQVPYGRVLDRGRALMQQRRPARSRIAALAGFVLSRAWATRAVVWLLWLYQRSGFQRLLRRLGLLRGQLARLDSLLPRVSWSSPPSPYPLPQGEGEKLALFANCTSPWAEPGALRDAQRLLRRCGFDVSVPAQQTCCGALHQHAGLTTGARSCAQRNLAAFADAREVVGIASGCTAQLAEYAEIWPGAEARAFQGKVRDIHAVLLEHAAKLPLKPLRTRIAVHTPCTLRNVLRGGSAVTSLLKCIPEAEIVELDAVQHCCGAAGSYFLTQPDMADALLERKIEAVRALKPDTLASSNIGCSLHIAAGLRRAGLSVPVVHPVSLLAQALGE